MGTKKWAEITRRAPKSRSDATQAGHGWAVAPGR